MIWVCVLCGLRNLIVMITICLHITTLYLKHRRCLKRNTFILFIVYKAMIKIMIIAKHFGWLRIFDIRQCFQPENQAKTFFQLEKGKTYKQSCYCWDIHERIKTHQKVKLWTPHITAIIKMSQSSKEFIKGIRYTRRGMCLTWHTIQHSR